MKHRQNYLYIQVPFRLLIASNVTMLIKVFKKVKSNAGNETTKIWCQGKNSVDRSRMQNIYKQFEGYAMINISDAFWKKNLKCGEIFRHKVQFYKPDLSHAVDDRFVTLLSDPVKHRNNDLQNELKFDVKYALMSSLAMHADMFDFMKTNLVMMKNFTRSLMSSHTYKSSQFLKNDEASNSVSYTSD